MGDSVVVSSPSVFGSRRSKPFPSGPPLTSEAILDASEQVLRRHGPAKTSVVDVARALSVSHGTIYRHYASKAALRDAVTERWLRRISAPLAQVAQRPGPAADRLQDWLVLLATTKQTMAAEDPELFATFQQLTLTPTRVVIAHVDHLAEQLSRIVSDGIEAGEFAPADPGTTGRAVLHATARFHHPAMAGEWTDPATLAADLDAVYHVLLDGLLALPAPTNP